MNGIKFLLVTKDKTMDTINLDALEQSVAVLEEGLKEYKQVPSFILDAHDLIKRLIPHVA